MLKRIFSTIFLKRLLFALVLTFGTYNAWGVSYYAWVTDNVGSFSIGMAIVGVVLLGCWTFLLVACWKAPSKLVFIFIPIVLVLCIYWMGNEGYIDMKNTPFMITLAQVVLAFTLALGSVWAMVWRGTTGQMPTIDGDAGSVEHNH